MESKYLYTIWALKLHEPPNFLELKTSKDGEHKCHWNLTIGEIRVHGVGQLHVKSLETFLLVREINVGTERERQGFFL